MDLMYLPDAFTFHVIRSPAYDARDYFDSAWEEEERRRKQKGKRAKAPPCANAEGATSSRGRQGKAAAASGGGGGGGGKDSCPMCKERKRRTLATYIRTKSRQDSECTIEEEPEEERTNEGGAEEGGNPAKELGCAS